MPKKNKPPVPDELPGPARNPEIFPPEDPEDPLIPLEEPDIIPDEEPFENPYEVPPPGEGP